MRRWAVLSLTALLAGCVYDPYTGMYVPCCTYPYAYPYRYPGYPAYPAYPAAPAAPAAPGAEAAPHPNLAQRFAQANVTHDGRLTYDQAQAAGWHMVARNFAAIDSGVKGYVTLEDVHAWEASRRPAQPAPPMQ